MEHDEQSTLFRWCELRLTQFPDLKWLFAIPNGAKFAFRKTPNGGRYSPQANYLKAEGALKPGIVDIFLPVPVGEYHGLWIEMKYKKNKMSPEQEMFANDMMAYGYAFELCRSAREAAEKILTYLGSSDAITYSNELGDDYDGRAEI